MLDGMLGGILGRMPPGRRLVLVLGPSQLLVWATIYYIPAAMNGAVAAGLGATPQAVLGGFSLALVVVGLLSPLMCRAIDRRGGRAVMVPGAVVQILGLLLMARADGLGQWYAGWVVAGIGMSAGLYDAAFATTGRALGAAARPAITGITLVGGFAASFGWPLGAALLPFFGWRGSLLLYAALIGCVNLPLLLCLPRGVPAAAPGPARAAGPAGNGPGEDGAGRRALLLVALFFTVRSAANTLISIGLPGLLLGLGLLGAAVVGVVALVGPAQVGIRLLQVSAGRNWTPLAMAWFGALLFPASLLLPLSGLVPVLAGGVVLAVGFGLSNGILTIARGTLPLFLFGPVGYATRIGQIALPVVLAQAAAPVLAAPVLGWPFVFMAVLLALGLLSCCCLLPLRGVRPAG